MLVAAGLDVQVPLDVEPAPVPVPTVDGPRELPALLSRLRQLPGGTDPVVALVPCWGPARQRETWDAARALLAGRRLLVVGTDLPPLSASLLAATLAALEPRLGSAEACALAVGHVEREVVGLAWLSSVTGLARVDVPLELHARSYLTRRGFLVRPGPDASVAPVGREPAPLDLDLPDEARVLVAAAGDDGGWRERVLQPAVVRARTSAVRLPAASEDWWGCSRLVEVAVGPGDLDALAARVRAAGLLSGCRWCGALAPAGGTCVRCGQTGSHGPSVAPGPVARSPVPPPPPPDGPPSSSVPPPLPPPSQEAST